MMFKVVSLETLENKLLIKMKLSLDKFNSNGFCINNKINSVIQTLY